MSKKIAEPVAALDNAIISIECLHNLENIADKLEKAILFTNLCGEIVEEAPIKGEEGEEWKALEYSHRSETQAALIDVIRDLQKSGLTELNNIIETAFQKSITQRERLANG